MARKNDGACARPKQIRTDVDRRAARLKFDERAWRPAKISDVSGGGLYLFVTPDVSRPGSAASKLWRMDYRFHSRQKTYSIGAYRNGRDGTFSLADARRERDKAKDMLKEGKDPSTEKQPDKHRQAAARSFEKWADEWLAKKKMEKVKRGRIAAVRDPKTIEVLELPSATSKIASATLPEPLRIGTTDFFQEHLAWLETIYVQQLSKGRSRKSLKATEAARMIISPLEGALLMERMVPSPTGIKLTLAAIRRSLSSRG